MLQRFLLLWLSLLSLAAFFWTRWFEFDPFVGGFALPGGRRFPLLSALIALAMLAIGSMLPRDEVAQVARRWPLVLAGTAVQYLSMPLLAFGFARLFQLEGPYLIGLMFAGCVPGAMASNVLTLLARGNVSYSVGLTTSATLISPIVVPLALHWTLGETVAFPAIETGISLAWMVVLPVVSGYLLSRSFPSWARLAARFGSTIANLTILWVIAVVVAGNRQQLGQLEAALFYALIGLNLAGFAIGYAAGRLLRITVSMRRALVLEIGMQNAGLGALLAKTIFGDQAALAPAFYTFACMATGTGLAIFWSRRETEPNDA